MVTEFAPYSFKITKTPFRWYNFKSHRVIHGAGGFCDTDLMVIGGCLLNKALSTAYNLGAVINSDLRISALKASMLILCIGL